MKHDREAGQLYKLYRYVNKRCLGFVSGDRIYVELEKDSSLLKLSVRKAGRKIPIPVLVDRSSAKQLAEQLFELIEESRKVSP